MPIKLKDTDYSQKKQSHKKILRREHKKKERKLLSKFPLLFRGAVGETRTRTGLLPLPPQSSVSTISPPPLLIWDCKYTYYFYIRKLFCNFF